MKKQVYLKTSSNHIWQLSHVSWKEIFSLVYHSFLVLEPRLMETQKVSKKWLPIHTLTIWNKFLFQLIFIIPAMVKKIKRLVKKYHFLITKKVLLIEKQRLNIFLNKEKLLSNLKMLTSSTFNLTLLTKTKYFYLTKVEY